MNVIGKKYIFLSVSLLLLIASVSVILVYGFKPGIDFAGGTLWQIRFSGKEISRDELKDFFTEKLKVSDAVITDEISSGSFIIRSPEISEANHQDYLVRINKELSKAEELRFETIGSAIGGELRTKALTAFILVLMGISLYIAFAFRKVSRPVSSWKYGVITLLTLFHDALIPAGLFAYLGHAYGAELDTNFIVAILVVMGFSVHDTIVVFDRIRENLRIAGFKSKSDFDSLVNNSVNQTMVRSINTSLTLILVLIAMYFLGAANLQYFILIIAVGTIVGTYSSIFIASPLLTLWQKKV